MHSGPGRRKQISRHCWSFQMQWTAFLDRRASYMRNNGQFYLAAFLSVRAPAISIVWHTQTLLCAYHIHTRVHIHIQSLITCVQSVSSLRYAVFHLLARKMQPISAFSRSADIKSTASRIVLFDGQREIKCLCAAGGYVCTLNLNYIYIVNWLGV